MSAVRQISARESEAISSADPEMPIVTPPAGRDDPILLLRTAIARLKAPHGDLPDQAEVANLLAETREALERMKVIAGAIKECGDFLKEARFDQAFEALDAGLAAYPADPILVARRREVEEEQSAIHTGAAVRTALDEAGWLLGQGRTDLATQFLREKVAKLPEQPALISHLEELEALLPRWERERRVQATLDGAAMLEELRQWQAALTILEEALHSYPDSEELIAASKRVRDRLVDDVRQKKLAHRVELIGQKIAAQSWRQALSLLEGTQKDFPGEPELSLLRREVDAGLRRSECEALAAEARQCLADGEFEQAERAIREGLESFGPEPSLEALRRQLEIETKYREELRKAQVLFGQRRLREAERVLEQLAAPDRPEAHALLDAVRGICAATEEEKFYESGRGKALELIQGEHFAQAADLLRNLLLLFPGDPILERDLRTAQTGVERCSQEVAPPAGSDHPALQPEVQAGALEEVHLAEVRPSRIRGAAIAGAASLMLGAAAGAAWMISRNAAPVARPAAAQPTVQAPLSVAHEGGSPSAAAPGETPPQPACDAAGTGQQRYERGARRQYGRSFRRKLLRTQIPAQHPVVLEPPGAEATTTAETVPGLPGGLARTFNAPAPPPAARAPIAKRAPAPGGRLEAAELINRTLPVYPALARERGISGIVRLEALIDERGAVTSVTVLRGDPVLTTAARNAVLKWRYKPARLNGRPIATTATIQVLFGDRNK